MLEKLIEIELKGGERGYLDDVDTVSAEETLPTLLLVHVIEGLGHVETHIFGRGYLSQDLQTLQRTRHCP
jgi:hypothetical protein